MSADPRIDSLSDSSNEERTRRIARWLNSYQTISGVRDELIGEDGKPRSHWLTLLETLADLGEQEIENRFAAARRRIDDIGMTYRVRGDLRERPWPLSRLPVLLPEHEWKLISEGIKQRAELLDVILGDIYGKNELVKEDFIPAALIAGSPEYLRALHGTKPAGGRWLRIYAADIGRGPDGRWWVLGDRAQAPSGAGYALENRLVMARTFPSLYRDMNVQRLAGYFRDMRSGLASAANRSDPRICLMTPGPWSESYSEQAYLARYLGFLLVEGEDLAVVNNKLFVRTVAGMKRTDVVWRRVDADWCDPLEGNAASRIGVPGLFDAIRKGNVTFANMPGAGLVESRALLSFLPSLSRKITGKDLLLPNIATWWCGQDIQRDEVINSFASRAISGAFGDTAEGLGGKRLLIGGDLDPKQRQTLMRCISDRGMDYVGQEIVQLSTTPSWDNDILTPRPFALRVFAAATPNGWKVLPGGFCRISAQQDARAVSLDAGAHSADVWVLSDAPVEAVTLLPVADDGRVLRIPGNLPSRAADNLYWMGRYIERAEATLRIVRCMCNRSTEISAIMHGRQPIERCARLLISWGINSANQSGPEASIIAHKAVCDHESIGSALSIIKKSKLASSIVRERLSQDVWQLLCQLETNLEEFSQAEPLEPETLEAAEYSLQKLAALSGIIDENFNRASGWLFLDLGKRIERSINTCRYARQLIDEVPTLETLDALLELVDSQITYRARYLAGPTIAATVDMAILDPYNPRSVAYQVMRINEHLSTLPALQDDGILEIHRRLSLSIGGSLEAEDARMIDVKRILTFEQSLLSLANAISDRYFSDPKSAVKEERSGLA